MKSTNILFMSGILIKEFVQGYKSESDHTFDAVFHRHIDKFRVKTNGYFIVDTQFYMYHFSVLLCFTFLLAAVFQSDYTVLTLEGLRI